MKKRIVWIGLTLLTVIGSFFYFSYQKNREENMESDTQIQKQDVSQQTIEEPVDLEYQKYEILEMELNDDLHRFPKLIGKQLDPAIPVEMDENGKLTNGVKLLSVHFILTNQDEHDPNALCNGFQLVNPDTMETDYGLLREMDLNNFRADTGNREYFHTGLKKGESKDIWVGFFVTDDELKNEKLALDFTIEVGDEGNRQIPIDAEKLKKTY